MADKQISRAAWERQESRVIRPFKSAGAYLSDCRVRLHSDDDFSEGPVVLSENVQRDRLALALRVPLPPADMEDAVGARLSELSLVVSLEDKVFKKAAVLWNRKLSEHKSEFIELGEIDSRISWASGTQLHVAVVLAQNRKAGIGLARRAGSWVAKKSFVLKGPGDTSSFQIEAVNDDFFKKLGLPGSTTYFVSIQDPDLNQAPENVPHLVKVFMHEDVYWALAKDEDSIVAKAMIRNIYVDVTSTILCAGFSAVREEIDPAGILGLVAKRITKSTGITLDKLRAFAKDGGGAQLRAVIQAEASLNRSVIAAASRRAS